MMKLLNISALMLSLALCGCGCHLKKCALADVKDSHSTCCAKDSLKTAMNV